MTAKPATPEGEKAAPGGPKTSAPEKPAEGKPAAPMPEPKPDANEPGVDEPGAGEPDAAGKAATPKDSAEPEKPEAGRKGGEIEGAPEEDTGDENTGDEETGEEDTSGEAAPKEEFREIPEMTPTPDPACAALKDSGMAEFETMPPLSEGVCGTSNPIRATAIRLADGTKVALEPAPVARCSVIAALATWMREDVEPAARDQLGGPVTALHVAGSYVCRGRDGNPGAQLSEHGRANAIDISAFKTKSGQWKNVRDMGAGGNGFLAIVRGKACGRFTTVIGPGLDKYHADHLHLDTKLRGRNGRSLFCQ